MELECHKIVFERIIQLVKIKYTEKNAVEMGKERRGKCYK